MILDILTTVIEAEIANLEARRVSDYDNPNWPYRQADLNGAIRAYDNLLKMTRRQK